MTTTEDSGQSGHAQPPEAKAPNPFGPACPIDPMHVYAARKLLEAGSHHEALVELRLAFGLGTEEIKHPDGRLLAEIILPTDVTDAHRLLAYEQAAEIAKERLDWLRDKDAKAVKP